MKLSHSAVLGGVWFLKNSILKNFLKRRLELTNLQTNKHDLVHASVVLIIPHDVRVRVQAPRPIVLQQGFRFRKQSASHLQILTGRYLHRRWPWRSRCCRIDKRRGISSKGTGRETTGRWRTTALGISAGSFVVGESCRF